MTLVVYVLIELTFALLGLVVGRFGVALVPVVVWLVWGEGVYRHWWGNDGEQILPGTLLLIVLGSALGVAGVVVHRVLARHHV